MKLGKALTIALTVLCWGLLVKSAQAADFYITAVTTDFPMKAGEPLYKDFYINAGTNNGLKKGILIEAVRKMNTYDNINSKLLGDTAIKIARLRLIHVDKNVSIARLVKFYDKDKTPMTGIDSVMIGDFIEVSETQ